VLLGPRRGERTVVEASSSMAAAVVFLAVVCVVLGLVPGVLFGALVTLAPWVANTPTGIHLGLSLPGTGSLPTVAVAVVLVALVGGLLLARGRGSAAPAPSWACGQLVEPTLNWTSAGFTKPLRLVLEVILRPRREITVRSERGVVQEVTYRGYVPHLIEERMYGPIARRALVVAAHARRLQSGSLGVYVAYLIGLVIVLLGAARIGLLR
jgi:hydrogenase-4 component B